MATPTNCWRPLADSFDMRELDIIGNLLDGLLLAGSSILILGPFSLSLGHNSGTNEAEE